MAVEEDKEKEYKEIAENVEAAGNALLSPPLPSSDQQLLLLLDKLENYLLGVKQSPSNSVQKALKPASKALTTKEFLYHSNVDVKVGVASCIIEIMRITAPDAPYGDEQMKEIFKLIVAAFDNISDVSSPSYRRRVSILETFARIRLWVVMMDLECDSLILEMFELFLKNLRENHPDAVFMYMGYIMIMVLEEVEEISPELLPPILGCIRKGNKSVLPITRKLGERVIENCISKLLPYMHQTVQYLGFPLDDYGKIIAYICKQNSETLDHNKIHAFQDSTGQKHLKIFRSAVSDKDSSVSERNVSMKISRKKSKKKGNPRKEKGYLAPDNGEHFGANLIGSRIKVSSKKNMSCEGNIVSYDPIEKKHKVQFTDGDEKRVLLLKEQWEFVGNESAACKGKIINNPILDASCEMHENKKPKINSNSSNEEMIRTREEISTAKSDVKISSSNILEGVETAVKSGHDKTLEEVGNTDTSRAVESKNGVKVCSMPKESTVNNSSKLSNDDTIKKDDTNRTVMEEGEDKKGRPRKELSFPHQLKKARTPIRKNHKLLMNGWT